MDNVSRKWWCRLDHFEVAAEFDFRVDDDKKDIRAVDWVTVLGDMVEGWETRATRIG
jgi:hypothetical protein